MKKLIMAAAMTAVMAVSASAFAATEAVYVPDNNSVSATEISSGAYKTVLITDASGEIYYVNQDDSGFDSAVKFLMKTPAAGTYTLKMGGNASGEMVSTTFEVSTEAAKGLKPMTPVTEEAPTGDYKRVGFTMGSCIIDDYQSIVVTYKASDSAETSLSLAYPLDKLFTGIGSSRGNATLGVQITEVPKDAKVEMSLSKDVAEDKSQPTEPEAE